MWGWVQRVVSSLGGGVGGGGGSGIESRWDVSVAVGVTAMAGVALAAAIIITSRRGSIRSPWSRRKRKHALSRQQWNSFFNPDGTLRDRGVKMFKKIRSGGVDPSIRAEVWPFLLGVYDLNSSESERSDIRIKNRKEYEKLRRLCCKLVERCAKQLKEMGEVGNAECGTGLDGSESSSSENFSSARPSLSTERDGMVDSAAGLPQNEETPESNSCHIEEDEGKSGVTHLDTSPKEIEPSDTDSSVDDETETILITSLARADEENSQEATRPDLDDTDTHKPKKTAEDFETWQRIIRLDAIRANDEWIKYSKTQASVSEDAAQQAAIAVRLKDYEHLESCRIYHAARLVAVLEAYAIYDPEIGYCQGMSDLLTPILTVMDKDDEAFWCFVGFMKKARHNFRLDEVGIRRQLSIVSKIIKCKDTHLFRHLEKLQAEDCFFVYRMVVVMFRRELTFEQTVCLWEVMWADQAAIRAGIGKSAWGRIRSQAPPTDDLLLYAIAASVLQRRKLIIEKYSSMDEIIRECNSMAGHLDVWKLLDDAHDLVVTLHDKIG
ncbi:Ypt/Rab-specific GTPase-activating protein GYP7 and related proteins protein [Dioscorea alata]|uniref:Ypt/Rab-specific GTPase-activating protein GYP7 and related proteins protein n=1 Tax=Dioscorea alata TaxID=55571 RepID=A0ACB7WGK1_DIOAL|nr:Ypt/Rab-specific GTPase-activating protein GYP7 and related proteins protein [Dioscorea alata]